MSEQASLWAWLYLAGEETTHKEKWLVQVFTAGRGRPAQCRIYYSCRPVARVSTLSPAWWSHRPRFSSVGGPLFCYPWLKTHKVPQHAPLFLSFNAASPSSALWELSLTWSRSESCLQLGGTRQPRGRAGGNCAPPALSSGGGS